MRHNILITSAGKRVALVRAFQSEIRKISASGRVYTTDMNPALAPACNISDKSFAVPRATNIEYVDTLLDICSHNNIGLVVPTIDTELPILALNKLRFSQAGVHVSVSDHSFVAMCRDKRNTSAFFEKVGISVPRSIDKLNPTFPLFAKPYDGSLSKNLHIVNTPEELTSQIMNDPKLIFMELVNKTRYKEFTVDLYYGRDNMLKSIVPRERVEVRAGEINKGYTRKNFIVEFVRKRMEYVAGVVGCICMQLFYDERTDDIKGIEINPRFGGGYPLSYAAGANFPEYLIREYLFGDTIEYSDKWTDNMLMMRYDDAIFVG